MSFLCWLLGHSWKPIRLQQWGKDFNEAYVCRYCGKYEED
jgi:hypothetical protein